MLEEREGWFVVNVGDAKWYGKDGYGRHCSFEMQDRFPHTGVGIHVLEPGQRNCHYHRESAQEDFLVLSGHCIVLVNGDERPLGPWDYVHCPPGVSHVFVGAGDGPCVIVMIGHRPAQHELYYPQHPLAEKHAAQTPEPTPDPAVAYAGVPRWQPIPPPSWPLDPDGGPQ